MKAIPLLHNYQKTKQKNQQSMPIRTTSSMLGHVVEVARQNINRHHRNNYRGIIITLACETHTPPPPSSISAMYLSKRFVASQGAKPPIHSLFRYHTHSAMPSLTLIPSPYQDQWSKAKICSWILHIYLLIKIIYLFISYIKYS